MKISQNSDLIRRIKLYAIGFFLGLIAVGFIYKGRGCKMPGKMKLEELYSQQIKLTDKVICTMQCMGITDSVLVRSIEEGKINYDESMVRNKPYPFYAVETTINNNPIRIIIYDEGIVSKITNLQRLEEIEDTCNCN